jgi:hypothetical protein
MAAERRPKISRSRHEKKARNKNWRISVGTVLIKCPQTGRAISTGIKADRKSFLCSAVFFARTHCPICVTRHEWFSGEAWVDELRAERGGVAAIPQY